MNHQRRRFLQNIAAVSASASLLTSRVLSPRRPSTLVAPFTDSEAKAAQRFWASYLGIEPGFTNELGVRLALIPTGGYLMGSPTDEAIRDEDEMPHWVRVTRPFFLGVYEVTQREWEAVMGSQPSYFSRFGDGRSRVSGLDTSRFPVEQVSWEESTEFCRKLGERDDRTYRLPTEAEWEYACRAGTTTALHLGTALNGDKANVNGDFPYGTTVRDKNLRRTTQVGSYRANAFGMYDMHGNVWEWCQDWYGGDYFGQSVTDDPSNTMESESRVIRGGSWYDAAGAGRSANREWEVPVDRLNTVGFRIACAIR